MRCVQIPGGAARLRPVGSSNGVIHFVWPDPVLWTGNRGANLS